MSSNGSAAVCFLSMEDPKTSVKDPAFNALLQDGWEIKSNIIVERMGRHELCLLLTKQPKTVTNFTKKQVFSVWLMLFSANLFGSIILKTLNIW